MKLHELVKPTKARKMVMILNEIQFRALAQNVLNEQEQKTIKNTHLIKVKSDVKKK
mgnify:CR=1 FL=1|jgi:hypothetical protein